MSLLHRGKGVGSMLMRWAEQTSESVMLREVPALADADKCRMLLRVSLHACVDAAGCLCCAHGPG